MSTKLSAAELKRRIAEKTEASAIPAAAAKKLRLEPIADVSKLPGMSQFPAKAGARIPYFDVNGRERPKVCRVRYMEETRSGFKLAAGAKPMRYVQTPGSPVHVYFPPLINWKDIVDDPGQELIITEGELKAACATAHGKPTLGLGGVWSFRSTKHLRALIDDLEQIAWDARHVYICYDSDAVSNPMVVQAEHALATELSARGATVHVIRLGAIDAFEADLDAVPTGEETAIKQVKLGLDDFIAQYGIGEFERIMSGGTKMENGVGVFPFEENRRLLEYNGRYVYVRSPSVVHDLKTGLTMPPERFVNWDKANDFLEVRHETKDGNFKMEKVRLARAWIEWPARNEMEKLVFEPGCSRIYEGSLNTWQGWGTPEPKKGCVKRWHKLLDHVFKGSPAAERRWFEQWLGYPLAFPGTKMLTAVLVWGPTEGTGKTLIAEAMRQLYHPEHSVNISDAQLEDEGNEWAVNKQFILADDITGKNSRQLHNRIKTLITQSKIYINPKYINPYHIRDCMNYYFTSNDADAMQVSDNDRRVFVHEVRNTARLDLAFSEDFVNWIESAEGRAALFYYFQHLDYTGFNPKAPAMETHAKKDMASISKGELASWVSRLAQYPDEVLGGANMRGDLFTAEELLAVYDPMGDKKATANGLARFLGPAGIPKAGHGALHCATGVRRLYIVRNQDKWRDADNKSLIAEFDRHRLAQVAARKPKKY